MKKAVQYIVFTCVVSWILAAAAILSGLPETKGLLPIIFNVVYMFLPAICAIILQLLHKEKPFRKIYISFKINRWFFIAGFVPIILIFITFCINILFPNVSLSTNYDYIRLILPAENVEQTIQQLSQFPFTVSIIMQIGQALVMGFTISNIFAFGEELGWRGYLLKLLQNKKFLPVSLFTGFIWGIWHFPLILIGHNYPLNPLAGIGMMTVVSILLTPIMIYIVIKSKSVITASLFHGVMNAFGGIGIFYLSGGNDLTNGLTGLAGVLALLFANMSLYLFDRFVTKDSIFTKKIGEYLL